MSDEEIELLEREIVTELEHVAQSVSEKYEKFVPVMDPDNMSIVHRLEGLHESMERRIKQVSDELNKENIRETAAHMESLRNRLANVNECREAVERFSLIERNLVELGMLRDVLAEPLQAVNLLLEAKKLLSDALEVLDREGQLSRIHNALHMEYAEVGAMVGAALSTWFKEMFSFPPSHVPNVSILRVQTGDSPEAFKRIEAMEALDELNDRLTKVADYIVDSLVDPILVSANGQSMVECSNDPINKQSMHEGSIALIIRVKGGRHAKSSQEIMPDNIFAALTQIFYSLSNALRLEHGRGWAGPSLERRLGKILEQPLMTAILKKVVTVVSVGEEEGDRKEEETMKLAEKFREDMIMWGFFNEATPSFSRFAEQNDRLFIDRKCGLLLARARELIQMLYTDLVTVGSGAEMELETHDQFTADFAKVKLSCMTADSSYPKLFQLLTCKVSQSTVDLFELIHKTMSEAIQTADESSAARLALTGRNMVQLFLLLAPRHHRVALSSVPQMAAVYYNNCYYLCHRIMLLTFDVLKEVNLNSPQAEYFRPLFSDFVWQLRESAAGVMETLLKQTQRQISALLPGIEIITNGDERAVAGCRMQIESLAAVWKEVLPEAVYCKCLGNICSFLFDELFHIIQSMEDITTKQAEFATVLLEKTLAPLEKLFFIRENPMMQKECTSSFFRYKELIFLLNGSLQGVDDRWCDGKGPLAEYLKADEVRHLVKALFANTEQRKRLLDTIY